MKKRAERQTDKEKDGLMDKEEVGQTDGQREVSKS